MKLHIYIYVYTHTQRHKFYYFLHIFNNVINLVLVH